MKLVSFYLTNLLVFILKIALEKNFTRGRKSEQVRAACLYIAFRYGIFLVWVLHQPVSLIPSLIYHLRVLVAINN